MPESLVERWVRREVRAQPGYTVADAAGFIKLDAMENPYGWPQPLVEEWLDCLRSVALNRYPDSTAAELKLSLRATLGVPPEQGLMLGNGSDELIQIIAQGLAAPGRTLLTPEPTFSMYRIIARHVGLDYQSVPLAADFDLHMQAMHRAIEAYEPAIIFLAYPNNPTGTLWPRAAIEAVIARAPGLVVVDEAYAPFATDSFLTELNRFDNLLVMRTLSKIGLAGLRLGLLAGPAAWLAELEKLRLPYNINVLTQASAAFAMRHADVLETQAGWIREARQHLSERLAAIDGIEVFPSQANFLLLRTPPGQAKGIFDAIKARGVLVKDVSAPGLLADCLRVTVGREEENRHFITALHDSLDALKQSEQ